MKTRNAKDEHTAFEAWAQLLISRKVPDDYQHLINSNVVGNGAEILKSGEAFEVRICDRAMDKTAGDWPGAFENKQILVTPFPVSLPRSHAY